MHKCIICKEMKYYLILSTLSLQDTFETKHVEICYKCLEKIGFRMPHRGD